MGVEQNPIEDKKRRNALLCEQNCANAFSCIPIEWRRMKGFGKTSLQAVTMKLACAVFLLAAALLLAGCSGFWNLPSSSSSTSTTPTTLSSGVFYVMNQTAMQIAAYSIVSGTLTPLSGSPYSSGVAPGATPYSMAIAPGGGYLYLSTVSGIYAYSITTNGFLSIANGGSPISSDIANAMQVGPNGTWLIDAFINTGGQVQLDATPLNSSGTYLIGANVPSVAFTITNASVKQMALSPDGKNLFVALGAGGTIIVPFTASSSSPLGATARGIPVANTGGSALSVAVDPSDRLFYIGETLASSSASSGGLRAFNYSSLSGTLTQASGSPIASGGLAPNDILPEASGNYVYVANGQGTSGSGNVAWFPISASGTTYTIAAGSSVATGIQPLGLAEDSNKNFVLAVSSGGSTSSGNPDLEAYTMSSGALTAAITSATGTDPVGAAAIAALP